MRRPCANPASLFASTGRLKDGVSESINKGGNDLEVAIRSGLVRVSIFTVHVAIHAVESFDTLAVELILGDASKLFGPCICRSKKSPSGFHQVLTLRFALRTAVAAPSR